MAVLKGKCLFVYVLCGLYETMDQNVIEIIDRKGEQSAIISKFVWNTLTVRVFKIKT